MSQQETWAIVDLMGHRRLAGRLSEEEKFGSKLGRLDIPDAEGNWRTEYFGGSSVYSIAIVTEAVARHVAAKPGLQPVSSWDFPKMLPQAPIEDELPESLDEEVPFPC